MVPMNYLYGIRVAKAFTSDRNWYDINAYGGKLLLAFGMFLTIFGIVFDDLAPASSGVWFVVFIAGPIALVIPVLVLIFVYAKRLPD